MMRPARMALAALIVALVVVVVAAFLQRAAAASAIYELELRSDSLRAVLDTTRQHLNTFTRLAVPVVPTKDPSDTWGRVTPKARTVVTFTRRDTIIVDTVHVVVVDSVPDLKVVPFSVEDAPVTVDGVVSIRGDSAEVHTTIGYAPIQATVRVGCVKSAPQISVTAPPFDAITIDSAAVAPEVCRVAPKPSRTRFASWLLMAFTLGALF
jgi:hypothetical protein